MNRIEININSSLNEIINLLNNINFSIINIDIIIKFNNNNFVDSSKYLILVSFINELRKNNYIVNIELVQAAQNLSSTKYASRINFFKHLDIDYIENFKRNQINTLLPITHVLPNTYFIPDEVKVILKENFKLVNNDYEYVTFIIQEMICNTTMHSKCISGAYMYLQKYYDHLEFILIDSGIGIKNSLNKNPDFCNLNNEDALKQCLDFEVSSGEGRGHGLFLLKDIIDKTGGEIHIISGDCELLYSNKNINITKMNNWNGVFIKIKCNFGTSFDLSEFFELYEKLVS